MAHVTSVLSSLAFLLCTSPNLRGAYAVRAVHTAYAQQDANESALCSGCTSRMRVRDTGAFAVEADGHECLVVYRTCTPSCIVIQGGQAMKKLVGDERTFEEAPQADQEWLTNLAKAKNTEILWIGGSKIAESYPDNVIGPAVKANEGATMPVTKWPFFTYADKFGEGPTETYEQNAVNSFLFGTLYDSGDCPGCPAKCSLSTPKVSAPKFGIDKLGDAGEEPTYPAADVAEDDCTLELGKKMTLPCRANDKFNAVLSDLAANDDFTLQGQPFCYNLKNRIGGVTYWRNGVIDDDPAEKNVDITKEKNAKTANIMWKGKQLPSCGDYCSLQLYTYIDEKQTVHFKGRKLSLKKNVGKINLDYDLKYGNLLEFKWGKCPHVAQSE